jgi:uncharacterized protein (TIGR00730 family)
MKRICVYCGASAGMSLDYVGAALRCGETLAQLGIGLVYGGGNIGLMGAVADGALSAGGEVIGVIPHHLADKELAHERATQMIRVDSMHERKHRMAELSDGFLILPGGIGTLEEMFEVFTWLQLGLHDKPIGMLNVAGFYDPLLSFLDSMVVNAFLRHEHRDMLLVEAELEPLITRMASFKAPRLGKWWDKPSTLP